MNLFHKLGISHSVLFDGDADTEMNMKINKFIKGRENKFTRQIHQFVGEFEDFLGIEKVSDKRKKPLNVLWHYKNNRIGNDKIDELGRIVNSITSKSIEP